MNQIKAKIYYLISNGEVLVITSEMESYDIEETTKEQDMELYEQLKNKSIDEVDFIELEYGTLAKTFTNIKSYSIDIKNKILECVYYTKEELEEIQNKYEQKEQDVNLRISNISEYLNQDTSSIADIEDYILQIEQNKIINGGI